jgi:hypothetical protein
MKYLSTARPETSFGWDGAQTITRTEDWAEGPRYRARANGQTLLLYLQGDKVVGAYVDTDSGQRRNICRNADCYSRLPGDDSP